MSNKKIHDFNTTLIAHRSLLGNLDVSNLTADENDFIFFSSEEIGKIVSSLAHRLQSEVGTKETAVMMRNDFEIILTALALWQIGKTPFPINPLMTRSEISILLSSINCSEIITDSNEDFGSLKNISFPNLARIQNSEPKKIIAIHQQNNSALLSTSGSSALPKIAEFRIEKFYRSFCLSLEELGYNQNDRWLLSLPLFHIGGFSIFMRAIFSSAEIILPQSRSVEHLSQAFQIKPTITSLVPTQLSNLLSENIKPNAELARVLIGGGPSDDDIISTAINSGWKVYKVYGSTETAAFITAMNFDECKLFPASSGKALNGVSIKIEKQNDDDEFGEILISSPTLINGYKNSDAFDENYVNGFYRTGDFGYLNDGGFLFVVMRRSDLIITGGENVNPVEVENKILKLEAVAECCVIGLKDEKWGEAVTAIVVLKKGSRFSEKEFEQQLRKELAPHKIPKKYFVVDNIPHTATGKPKRNELKKFYNTNVE